MRQSTPDTSTTHDDRRDSRRKVRVGLASLAVLGLGFAATSALWSDSVNFGGSGHVRGFALEGAAPIGGETPTDSDWVRAPDELPAIEISANDLTISPDETASVWVRNTLGSSRAAQIVVGTPVIDGAGELSATAAPATTTLDPGESTEIVLSFDGLDDLQDASPSARAFTLTLEVTGTEVEPETDDGGAV